MIRKISIFMLYFSLLAIGIGVNLTNFQNPKGKTVELSLESLINSAEAQSESGNDCWKVTYVYVEPWSETRIVNGQVVIINHPGYYAEVLTWIC